MRLKRIRLAVVVLAATASLAACTGQSPLTALKPYAASDGLQVTSGDIRGVNLLLMTRGAGEPAVLAGTFDNTGETDATATVAIGGASTTIAIPAGESVKLSLGKDGMPFVLDAAPAAPGLLATLHVTVGSNVATAPVPVLDGTLPEYAPVIDALDAYVAAQREATEPSPSPSPSASDAA